MLYARTQNSVQNRKFSSHDALPGYHNPFFPPSEVIDGFLDFLACIQDTPFFLELGL